MDRFQVLECFFDTILRLGFHLWTDLDFGSGRVPLCLRAIFWFCSFPVRLGLIRASLLYLPARFSSLILSPFLDFGWLLERRRVLPGLRASALLSLLSSLSRPRLTERRGTTPPSSAQLRIIRGTRRISPRERWFQGETSISSNFRVSGLRDSSSGWDDCQL